MRVRCGKTGRCRFRLCGAQQRPYAGNVLFGLVNVTDGRAVRPSSRHAVPGLGAQLPPTRSAKASTLFRGRYDNGTHDCDRTHAGVVVTLMNIARVWIPSLFVFCSIANFLNVSRFHDALCLDARTGQWVWCWPGPHLVPTFDAQTYFWEAVIIMLCIMVWIRAGKTPS